VNVEKADYPRSNRGLTIRAAMLGIAIAGCICSNLKTLWEIGHGVFSNVRPNPYLGSGTGFIAELALPWLLGGIVLILFPIRDNCSKPDSSVTGPDDP
jgi:hypothetical protein